MSSKEDQHKERQRVTKACDNCRKKKIKCDAKGETCTSCELLQIQCLYLDPTKKRGPPKGAGRYINAIEDRLHRMEAIVGGLVREDDPIFQSGDEAGLRALLSSPSSRSRGSRDSYTDSQVSDLHYQQPQSFLQHPNRPDLDHQHHPPSLHDYNGMMQQQQLPLQYTQQQQPFPRQYSNGMVDMQLIQSPDMGSQSHSDGIRQSMDATRTSPLHRDLVRENTLQSFNSPSPVLSSDHSIDNYAESPTVTPENLPRLGVNTPPVPEIDDLEDDMGYLTLDMGGRERYVGKSSPMYYAQRHYGGQQSAREKEIQKPEALKFVDNPDLPSPEVMTHLLNLHFNYIHPFAPVFVWSKFLKRLQDRDYTPSFLFLLNCIFALAARFSDDVSFRKDPSKPETVGVVFADKAKEILDTLYDSPDMHCVGALCLLAYQQMGTGNGYRSWMYVGISIRMAQHLGLNRDCMKLNPHMSAVDREERNRNWWTCFIADRLISTSFGRPQGINEHDVDATYPEGIDEEHIQLEFKLENATSMLTGPSPLSDKNFIYMASLMRILGRVMVSLYSPMSRASSKSSTSMTNPAPLEQLDKELTDWLLTLPPHLQFRSVQQEAGTFVCTLHMSFYAVLILLHRPYSHRSSHNTPNDPSISLSICTSAANNTIEMASNMMRSIDDRRGVSRLKGMLHNSVFIFFTAAIVHITNCTSTDPVLAASAKLRTIEALKCLAMVEDIWITGKLAANNIKQLLKARNIELPYSTEVLKNLPLGSVEDMRKKIGTESAQVDISMAAAIPKEQSFAFDVDHIMGYYQNNAVKHVEHVGRNSRHFSPTPYFSPVAGHHHHHYTQAPIKSHPGLSQGHSPLPRRPRQGKNTSPSPSASSVSSAPSTTPTSGFFPSLPDTSTAILGRGLPMYNNNNGNINGAISNSANAQLDPFAAPGSATVTKNGMPSQQSQQLQQSSPVEANQPLNMYQNPFSSSLWGLPTSMDNDEWMLYMQSGSGGGNGEGVMDLGVNGQSGNGAGVNSSDQSTTISAMGGNLKSTEAMFGPLTEFNAALLDQNSTNTMNTVNNGSCNNSSPSGRMHPLAQSLTRNELLGGADQTGIIDTSNVSSAAGTTVIMTSIPDTSASLVSNGFSQQQQQQQQQQPQPQQQHQPQLTVQHQALLTTQQPSEYFFLSGSMGMAEVQPQQQQQHLHQ